MKRGGRAAEQEEEEEEEQKPARETRGNRRGGFRADTEISPILEGCLATPLACLSICHVRVCVCLRVEMREGLPFSSRETPIFPWIHDFHPCLLFPFFALISRDLLLLGKFFSPPQWEIEFKIPKIGLTR